VTANGKPTQLLYAGIAPGEPEGVDQINIQFSDPAPTGNVSIILTVGSAASQPYVLILP
jgi:uncharacterized protein (TIGR03437 family)